MGSMPDLLIVPSTSAASGVVSYVHEQVRALGSFGPAVMAKLGSELGRPTREYRGISTGQQSTAFSEKHASGRTNHDLSALLSLFGPIGAAGATTFSFAVCSLAWIHVVGWRGESEFAW